MTTLDAIPWQIPLAEYQQYRWDNTSEERRGNAGFAKAVFYEMVKWDHEGRVNSALVAGETVLPEVLKDYPKLLKWINGERTYFDLRPGQDHRPVTFKEAVTLARRDAIPSTHNDPINW